VIRSSRSLRYAGTACTTLTILVAGCDSLQDDPTAPGPQIARVAPRVSSRPQLVPCPSTETSSASATVGPDGGVLTAAGSSILIPPGAVREPTDFTLTVPASDILEVDIAARDRDHFRFVGRVWVTVDYSRCPSSEVAGHRLGVWYIDPVTRELLEYRNVYLGAGRTTATFFTSHLSTYALAR
jgi:hypothetical protein